jgi:SNF2 family DNA or RNA helicase
MIYFRIKKVYGKPVSILIEGPEAASIPNSFTNTFDVTAPQESEIPLVQRALDEAVTYAQAQGIEYKIHPTVQHLLLEMLAHLGHVTNAATYMPPVQYDQYPHWEALYQHQQDGVKFVVRNYLYNGGFARVLLADDPRLGKSPLALASIHVLNVRGPVLILCPKALIAQWVEYVREWLPSHTTAVVTGTSLQKGQALVQALKSTVPVCVITNWETLRGLQDLFKVEWGAVIGDEAHKLKNRKSQISKQMQMLKCRHLFLLSATFVENMPDQWWQPLHLIMPKLFTSYWRWVGHYVQTRQDYNSLEFIGPKQMHIMKQQTAPFVLQRRSDQVADMPAKLYTRYVTALDGDHLKFYQEIEERARVLFSDGYAHNLPNKISAITAMRQAAIHPYLLDQSWSAESLGKLELLQTLVEEIPVHEQIVVFTSFKLAAFLAAKALAKMGGSAVYAGDLPESNVEAFKRGSVRTLCATYEKGGAGLNLFNANWVFFLDTHWSSIQIRQAEERIRAIGKREPCTIVRLIAQGSIDEYVDNLVSKKLQNASESEILSQVGEWLSQ